MLTFVNNDKFMALVVFLKVLCAVAKKQVEVEGRSHTGEKSELIRRRCAQVYNRLAVLSLFTVDLLSSPTLEYELWIGKETRREQA